MNYTITLTHAELCTLQDLLGDWSEYQDITGDEPASDATRETIMDVMGKLMTAEEEQ